VVSAAAGRVREQGRKAWKAAQLAPNERLGAERVATMHARIDDCMQRLEASHREVR